MERFPKNLGRKTTKKPQLKLNKINQISKSTQKRKKKLITITPRDALKAKVIPPGWYFCNVENHYTKNAATDGSMVHYYELVICFGPHKDTPIQELTISEKAIGMGKNFFIAAGQPKEQWEEAEKGSSISFDETLPVGKVVKAQVGPEKFGNRILNKAQDFLKPSDAELAQIQGS